VLEFIRGNTVFQGPEGGREYGGESSSGATMKGYQPGEAFYLSPRCRTTIGLQNGYWHRTALSFIARTRQSSRPYSRT